MAERIRGINPGCRVRVEDDFVSGDNVRRLLAPGLDVMVDCTDQVSAKIALVLQARTTGLPLVVCGGAGGKTNPLSLRASDLPSGCKDALLAKKRNSISRRNDRTSAV